MISPLTSDGRRRERERNVVRIRRWHRFIARNRSDMIWNVLLYIVFPSVLILFTVVHYLREQGHAG